MMHAQMPSRLCMDQIEAKESLVYSGSDIPGYLYVHDDGTVTANTSMDSYFTYVPDTDTLFTSSKISSSSTNHNSMIITTTDNTPAGIRFRVDEGLTASYQIYASTDGSLKVRDVNAMATRLSISDTGDIYYTAPTSSGYIHRDANGLLTATSVIRPDILYQYVH